MGPHVINWTLFIYECTLFFWLFCTEVASYYPGTLPLLTEEQFRRGLEERRAEEGVGVCWVGGESLQTLIQLLCFPLSFRTTSGHALTAPLGIERPCYLAEDLVSQASNAGPSSHTLRRGWAAWGRRGAALCIFTHFSQRGHRNLCLRKGSRER